MAQLDGVNLSFLKLTRSRFGLHRRPELSIVVETRLILFEDLHVLRLVLGYPVSRWMFSKPDLFSYSRIYRIITCTTTVEFTRPNDVKIKSVLSWRRISRKQQLDLSAAEHELDLRKSECFSPAFVVGVFYTEASASLVLSAHLRLCASALLRHGRMLLFSFLATLWWSLCFQLVHAS